jgi:hypothetical protein
MADDGSYFLAAADLLPCKGHQVGAGEMHHFRNSEEIRGLDLGAR